MTSKHSLWQLTLGAFRDDIESRSMPGCGAAAATAAVTGLALVLKGLRLTDTKHVDSARARLIEKGDTLVNQLVAYADEDVDAFKAYLAAQKQPDTGSPDEALEAAAERINRVPLDTAHACLEALELAGRALEYTKATLHSDTRAGAHLLHAGLCMVLINVDDNRDDLDDASERKRLAQVRQELQSSADRALNSLLPDNAS